MPKVSKKKLAPDLKVKSLNLFFSKIKSVDSTEKAENLLNNLFTAQEKDIVLRRLGVAILLKQGAKYREIENQLDISKATISKIKQISSGDGYGRNLRKRPVPNNLKYFTPEKKKGKKFFRPYKGAESII